MNTPRRLAVVVLSLLLVAGCGDSDVTPIPAPTPPPDASLAILGFAVTGEELRIGFRYTVQFQVQETTGLHAATITNAEFTLHTATGPFGTSRTAEPLQAFMIEAGATVDSRVLKITDDREATPYASRATVRVNYTDASQRTGFVEASADIAEPVPPPAPADPPAPTDPEAPAESRPSD